MNLSVAGSLLGYSEPAVAKLNPIMVEAKDMKKVIDKPGARLSSADDRKHVEEMLKEVSGHLPGIDPRSFKLARKACKDFFALPELFKDVPSTRQALKILSSIHNKGMSFYKLIDGLDPSMKELLTEQYQYELRAESEAGSDLLAELDRMPRLSIEELGSLKSSIRIVANLANRLQECLEVEKMDPQRPRRGFIQTMATAYEKSTGRPAKDTVHCDNARTEGKFGGQFFDLIWDCLVAAGAKPHSQRALYNDLKKTLKDRKPRTKLWSATNQN